MTLCLIAPARSVLGLVKSNCYSYSFMNRRVLIYRIGSIGDTVVALPAFRLIAQAFPDDERRVLTNFPVSGKAAPLEAVLAHTGLVHGYIQYPLKTRSLGHLFELRSAIKNWSPDILVSLTPARGQWKALRDAIFFKSCGIRRLVGVPWSPNRQRLRSLNGDRLYESEARRLTRCIAELGEVNLDDPAFWNLAITPAETRVAEQWLREWGQPEGFVACSLGTKAATNDWGIPNWQRLFATLSMHYPDIGLVLVGASEEREISNKAASAWRGSVLNLCGMTTPRESAAVLQRARVFLGHDSGPMHLAAAVATPCVAVFSARNKPGEWFPYGKQHQVIYHQTPCFGCQLIVCEKYQKKCIYSIEVSEVMAAVKEIISDIKPGDSSMTSHLRGAIQ